VPALNPNTSMGFLDHAPDLTGWTYSSDDLRYAREYLVSALTKHAPEWLEQPRGRLATLWRQNGYHAACAIIEVAQILYKLDRAKTAKSVPTLAQKFRQLVVSDGPQFEENFVELAVAAAPSERISPIAFEPLVPANADPSALPPSPDYGLKLPDGVICVEATVFRVGALDRWDAEAAALKEALVRYARRKDVSTAIEMHLPLDFSRTDFPRNIVAGLVDQMRKHGEGETSIALSSGEARIRWRPIPHVQSPDEIPENCSVAVVGTVSHAIAIHSRPVPPADMNDRILGSLRKTLDGKRMQRRFEGPYYVALALGHHRLIADGVGRLLAQRIWPNPQYNSISGVMHFTPRRGYQATDPPHSLFLQENEAPRWPAPASLIAAFEGPENFHGP
jgi:hypothetical protein